MASSLNRPPVITIPFADDGDRNVIPDTTSTSGVASMTNGFPPECMVPLPIGIPPDGKDINGILNIITRWVRFFIGGGQARWNSTLATAIGGYPIGAVLQLGGGSSAYRSTVDGNTYNPNDADPTGNGWQPWAGDVVATESELISVIETVENRNHPVGTIQDVYSVDSLASCWGIADGRTINYLGTDYVMPDYRDRFRIGKGTLATTIGAQYGSNNAVVVTHSHGITDPGHGHNVTGYLNGDFQTPNDVYSLATNGQESGTNLNATSTSTTGITINSAGVSGANANIPLSRAVFTVYKFRAYVYGD